jgi:hypothetical protein
VAQRHSSTSNLRCESGCRVNRGVWLLPKTALGTQAAKSRAKHLDCPAAVVFGEGPLLHGFDERGMPLSSTGRQPRASPSPCLPARGALVRITRPARIRGWHVGRTPAVCRRPARTAHGAEWVPIGC